jgi:hypothetical protein
MPIQSSNPPEYQLLQQWLGLNQQSRRNTIDDEEQWWVENLFAIGPGNLRSTWGPGPAIYTSPGPAIRRMFFGFIGNETAQFAAPPPGRLGWMFLDDGTIDQVDLDSGQVTHVGGAGRVIWNPVPPQYWASAKVWRPQFFGNVAGQQGGVLFGSPEGGGAGGLYAWDGSTLYAPGDLAPDWLTDQAETAPTAPLTTMPIGLPGIYCMEVFASRLFVAGKDVISFSAPSNGADFSTTDGGGSFGYMGDKLTYSWMDLAESSGFLYCFGDSSIHVIANINLIGQGTPQVPYVTNFNFQNLDPQVGQRFPRPVGRIGRYMQMWNGAGIFECQGGEAKEIGAKISNVYNTLDTSRYLPTMCPATMFGFRVLLCNGRFTDGYGVTRNLLLMWHPIRAEVGGVDVQQQTFWSVASQGMELTNIGAYEQDSVITPYGTDGQSLYQLFARPDPTLKKLLSTKFLRGADALGQMKPLIIKNWTRIFLEFFDQSGGGVSITGTLTTNGGSQGGVVPISFELPPSPGGLYGFLPAAVQAYGIAGGIDLQSISPDFIIERLHILAHDDTLFGA